MVVVVGGVNIIVLLPLLLLPQLLQLLPLLNLIPEVRQDFIRHRTLKKRREKRFGLFSSNITIIFFIHLHDQKKYYIIVNCIIYCIKFIKHYSCGPAMLIILYECMYVCMYVCINTDTCTVCVYKYISGKSNLSPLR